MKKVRNVRYKAQAIKVFDLNGNKPLTVVGTLEVWPTRLKPTRQTLAGIFAGSPDFTKAGVDKEGSTLWQKSQK
jgi:hypothetical protein